MSYLCIRFRRNRWQGRVTCYVTLEKKQFKNHKNGFT